MKYVLVDKGDNIITTADLASNVGLSGAKTYFRGIKRIGEKEFDKLWRVMTASNYHLQYKISLQNRQIEWWKEDKQITDDELKF